MLGINIVGGSGVYLIGAFGEASFDILTWSSQGRGLCCFGMALFLAASFAIAIILLNATDRD
jgi:hypothetical protein